MDDERAVSVPELAELLHREYGLRAGDLAEDLGGSYNLNLRVGDGDRADVVRVYGPWTSAERLAAVQEVRARLVGWPLPELRKTHSGKGFGRLGNRLVEVERYVCADGPMDSWPRLESGMRALARLHDALRPLRVTPAAAMPPVANYLPAADLVEQTEPALSRIGGWGLNSAARHYLESAQRLVGALSRTYRDDIGELPEQLVHGDFWHNNVLFRGVDIAAILDFDFLGVRPRIDDLALTLFFTNEHFGRDDVPASRLCRLVDRYDEALERRLTDAERFALPYAIARCPLTFLRDIVQQDPPALAELTQLRGPEYDWALRMLDSPAWTGAFRRRGPAPTA